MHVLASPVSFARVCVGTYRSKRTGRLWVERADGVEEAESEEGDGLVVRIGFDMGDIELLFSLPLSEITGLNFELHGYDFVCSILYGSIAK